MTDVPPDRLSVDPSSPFYDEATLARGIGVRFRGVERRDVEEYCVSEQWIRAAAGKALDRRGQPLVIKMTGAVEPYFLALPSAKPPITSQTDGAAPGSGRRPQFCARPDWRSSRSGESGQREHPREGSGTEVAETSS